MTQAGPGPEGWTAGLRVRTLSLRAPRPQALPPEPRAHSPQSPPQTLGTGQRAPRASQSPAHPTFTQIHTHSLPLRTWNLLTTHISHRQTHRNLVPGIDPDTGTIHALHRATSRIPPSRITPHDLREHRLTRRLRACHPRAHMRSHSPTYRTAALGRSYAAGGETPVSTHNL